MEATTHDYKSRQAEFRQPSFNCESTVSIRRKPRQRRDLIVASILALCTVLPVRAVADVRWLESTDLEWADNGDLVGWQVDFESGDVVQLVDPGKALLTLVAILDGEDISDGFEWRPTAANHSMSSEFVGTHTGLGIEIRRSYRPGSSPGTFVHGVEVTGHDGRAQSGLQLQVHVQPVLQRHAPNDGSLGDVFYGFVRWLGWAGADSDIAPIREEQSTAIAAMVVRHVAVVVSMEPSSDAKFAVKPETDATLLLEGSSLAVPQYQRFAALRLEQSAVSGTPYSSLMYSDMSAPLRGLARIVERVLNLLVKVFGNVGFGIILFAVLLRVLFLPLGLWSIRQQRHFAEVQKQMKPKIEQANKTMKGAAKSERILEIYKEHKISPFSGLKGSIGLFVQLPILIALFAVTTESAIFRDVSFLWVADLSLPDRAIALPFSIPVLGGYLNVLPILLGVVCVVAALIQSRSVAGSSPRSGLILALVFVVFFYSCATSLVLYWLVVNMSQIVEGQMVRRTAATPSESANSASV
jgi:YidC/Oxa1 family membrane protein insertase